ncbi:hypothetical protein J6590_042550 [Homalodisca vitripennis]|nr:hypothetical protein J6590_042550 [Homalodisca vitripennis]
MNQWNYNHCYDLKGSGRRQNKAYRNFFYFSLPPIYLRSSKELIDIVAVTHSVPSAHRYNFTCDTPRQLVNL